MKYTIEDGQDVRVVILESNLEGGWETFKLKDEITGRLGDGDRKFLIDMNNSNIVNSTGIGVLVALQTSIRNAEGELKLCRVSERAQRTFYVTGINMQQRFEIHGDRRDALRSFGIWPGSGG